MASSTTTPAKTGDTPTSSLESSKVVKYVGTADVREISEAGWKNADVEDQKMVRWQASNKWTVPVSELSDAAVAYLDEVDEGFVLTDLDVKS